MSRPDRDTVKAALLDQAEGLFRDLIGEPEKVAAKEWRTKARSSSTCAMRGESRGCWTDFASGTDGDLFDLIAVEMLGLSKAADNFPAVLDAAARWAGVSSGEVDLGELERRRAERDRKAAAEQAREAARKADTVAAIVARVNPIEGTPAAAYLAGRGITTWPAKSVAYLPGSPAALIVWAKDDAGRVTGGQRIYITEAGKRAVGADGAKLPKMGFGSIGGVPARLDGPLTGGPLYVAEGPETALSVWAATGGDVWAVFGFTGFKSAPMPLDRPVILCPDRDAAGSQAAAGFAAAVAHHLALGVDLWVAEAPEQEGSKADLNDTHQRAGLEAVRAALDAAVKVIPSVVPVASSGPVLRPAEALPAVMEVGEARDLLQAVIHDGLRRPGVTLIEATLGLGKTHATIAALVDLMTEAIQMGIVKPVVVITAPMHKLGRQLLEDIRKAAPGLVVVQLYGAEAQDPDDPSQSVCKRLDEYKERASLLLDMASFCDACPFAASCLHATSKATEADIYVASHERLKSSRPPLKAGQTLIATVVDESPLNSLISVTRKPTPLAGLMAAPTKIQGKVGTLKKLEGEADLLAYRARLEATIEAHGTGYLRLSALSGWTAEDAKAANALEWKRKIEDEKDPNVKGNRTLTAFQGIYGEILRSIEGQIEENARLVIADGPMGLECILSGLKPIGAGYRKAPVLMLDATAKAEVVERLAGMPLAHHAVIRARENVVIEQDPDWSGAKSKFFDWDSERRVAVPNGNVARVRRYIELQAMTGKTVAIGNKDTLASMGLPDHIQAAHFNALRGLNDFAEAETLVIVGRTLPNGDALSRMVAAIWGTPCVGEIRPDGKAWRLAEVDGVVVEAETKSATHDDPRAQLLLGLIRDAEVMQAAGRLRAVNRPTPVRCVLLSDAVVDYPVRLVDIRKTLRGCGIVGGMLERGVAFLSPSQASAAYPDLYASKQAAAKVLDPLSDTATFSIRGLYGKGCPVVTLKRPRSSQTGIALVCPSILDIEATIKALIPDAVVVKIERPAPAAAAPAEPVAKVIAKPPIETPAAPDTFASVGTIAARLIQPAQELKPAPNTAAPAFGALVVNFKDAQNANADRVVAEYFNAALEKLVKIRADRKAGRTSPASGRKVASGGSVPVAVPVRPEPRLVWMLEADPKPKVLPPVLRRYAVTEAGVRKVWDRAAEDIARAGADLVRASIVQWQTMTETDPDAWA